VTRLLDGRHRLERFADAVGSAVTGETADACLRLADLGNARDVGLVLDACDSMAGPELMSTG
jgi:hypothetical protein